MASPTNASPAGPVRATAGRPPPRLTHPLAVTHAALAFGTAAFHLVSFTRGGTPLLWGLFWAGACSLAAAAPWRPELGLAAYVLTFYSTPRYTPLFDAMANSHLLHFEVVLAVSGAFLWLGQRRHLPPTPSVLHVLAAALLCWGVLATAAGWARGASWSAGVRHSPVYFLHAAALFAVASQTMHRLEAALTFTLLFCSGLAVRVLWQGTAGLHLEGDVGPLAAMALPLAIMAGQVATGRWVRLLSALYSVGALVAAALTYNRATVLALSVVGLLMGWRHGRNRWIVAAAIPFVAVTGLWFASSQHWQRFEAAWEELAGRTTGGSVTERLELWQATGEMSLDHPLLGVGPGNFPFELERYAPRLTGKVSHNSYFHILAELGIPGLLLYGALFLAALVVSHRLRAGALPGWSGAVAGGIQVSLAAYLVAAAFISRHDMVLAYVLVGWVSALGNSPEGRNL